MRPHAGAADLQAAGDLGLADIGMMQFPDLVGVQSCVCGRAVVTAVGLAGAHLLAQ